MYRVANWYASLGWSVVPVAAWSKRPAVPWQPYQLRRPTDTELQEWFLGRGRGIGIVTGKISNLVVLDADPIHGGGASLKSLGIGICTATVETGGGGYHFYYQYPEGVVPSKTGMLPGLDVRAEGGFVVCPPTAHPVTYKSYKWVGGSPQLPLPPIPSSLSPLIQQPERHVCIQGSAERYFYPVWRPPVGEGQRNSEAARLAGRLVYAGLGDDKAIEILRLWNAENRPPLNEDEVLAVYHSIKRTHEQRNRRC